MALKSSTDLKRARAASFGDEIKASTHELTISNGKLESLTISSKLNSNIDLKFYFLQQLSI